MNNMAWGSLEQKQSSKDTKKSAVIVLGMHRSGTSSLTGTLIKIGASAPRSLMPANNFNEQGFFESLPIMYLNDAVLASAGSSWDDWRAFNSDWYKSILHDDFVGKAADIINNEFDQSKLIAVKDPRICRLMPFWSEVLERTGHQIHIIMPVRSPLEVATSLHLRNNFTISKGILLWLRHVIDAEAATRHFPSAIISWDGFLKDWRMTISQIQNLACVVFPAVSDFSAYNVDAFLNSNLRHSNISESVASIHPDISDWAQEAYKALSALSMDNKAISARDNFDKIRREFEIASKCFGRTLVDFQESEGRARRDFATESERAARCATERDEALVDRAILADQLAAAQVERDQRALEATEHRQNAERLAEECAALTDQLAAAQVERDQRASEATELRQNAERLAEECAALTDQLAAAQVERDQRASEAATELRQNAERLAEECDLLKQQRVLAQAAVDAVKSEHDDFHREL